MWKRYAEYLCSVGGESYGVYDYHIDNASFITLGTSCKTSAFVCDTIALAWQEDRAEHYPHVLQGQHTQTQTGLTVMARLLDTVYELGRKCSETFLDITDRFIHHDPVLWKWNYVFDAN